MELTQKTAAKLTIPAGKPEAIFFDRDLSGFGIRIREGGSRKWIVQYALGGKQRRMTLGSFDRTGKGSGVLDASAARATAKKVLAQVELGKDPAADRQEARIAATAEPLGRIIERFLARQERRLRPKSYTETKRYLERSFKPLHGLALARINRANVATRLAAIADENGPVAADRARAALSKFFAWAMGEGLAENNPVIGTNKASEGDKTRDRVLSEREVQGIWKAAPDNDYGKIVKLLILTGQRREEIGGLQWSEIDYKRALIALSGERTKNHRPHDVPLSAPALAVLESCHARVGRDHVFGDGPRDGSEKDGGGFQGWSKAKSAMEQDYPTNQPWRLHDIRRTVATGMIELGIAPHVVEAVLNHISGHRAGVAGVYNRASYATEKKAALDTWGAHVARLVS